MSILARAGNVVHACISGVVRLFWVVLGGAVLLLMMGSAIGHYHYLMADAPKLIQRVDEALTLEEDEPFLIRLPLDWKRGLQIDSSTRAYTLVPVAGSGGRLIVARDGHVQKTEKTVLQTMRGRTMGRDVFGKWDAGDLDSAVNVQSEFRRIGVDIPEDALLLVVDWEFGFDEYWQMALGTVALVIVLIAAFGLIMVVVLWLK